LTSIKAIEHLLSQNDHKQEITFLTIVFLL